LYRKKKIDFLFGRYVETKDDRYFAELIEACSPIVDIVLTKYQKYSRHFEDIKQEIGLGMWKNLRDPKKLKSYMISPSTYLFFCLRAYVARIFERFMRIYGDDRETISISESRIAVYKLFQTTFLSPDSQYIICNEVPKKMFQEIKKKIGREIKKELKKELRREPEESLLRKEISKAIEECREGIEFIFEVRLEDI